MCFEGLRMQATYPVACKSWLWQVGRNESRLMQDGVSTAVASIRQWGLIDHDGKRTKRENEHYFTTSDTG